MSESVQCVRACMQCVQCVRVRLQPPPVSVPFGIIHAVFGHKEGDCQKLMFEYD